MDIINNGVGYVSINLAYVNYVVCSYYLYFDCVIGTSLHYLIWYLIGVLFFCTALFMRIDFSPTL